MAQAVTQNPPLISVLMLAYNQQDMVRAAAESLLDQTGTPLEILLSDDASTDGTYEVIAALARDYRGPHRVVARRNERNQGIGEHLNTLVRESRGELLVVAAGDDISEPTRVEKLQAAWLASDRQLDLIASPLTAMDEHGQLGQTIVVDDLAQWRTIHDWLARKPYVIGAAHAWTRRVFERFGPLRADIAYEDQIMVFRAICAGSAVTLPEPLVRYRSGGTSARQAGRTAAARLHRLQVQNQRHLAELQQLTSDAGHTAHAGLVRTALSSEVAKQQYLQALLQATDWRALRHVALHPPQPVPLSWRWRKLWSVGRARLELAPTAR